MNIGIILATIDPENVWDVFRFANKAIEEGHKVKIFLLGRGVDILKIDDPKFKDKIKEEMEVFDEYGGELIACGTCIQLREQEWGYCPIGTMQDMLDVVTWADKLLVFSM